MYFLLSLAGNTTWLAAILLIIGLVAIIKGGDFFVDASVWLAEILKMPKFLIGATIVSLATTLPELLVSIFAVAEGNYAMSVGNAVGSVTANTGLILAINAIFVTGAIDRKDFGIKGLLIILSGLTILMFSLWSPTFGIIGSVILIIILVYYMYETIKTAKAHAQKNKEIVAAEANADEPKKEEKEEIKKDGKTITINILKFVFGVAGIIVGAQLLVDNATVIAKALHVSDAIIAITIVAVGTSLPELITTITAIVKKQGELGVGNIIGANIIDLTLILPICSFISGGNLEIVNQSRYLDIPVLLGLSCIAVIPTFITKKFHRIQGILMLLIYVAYVVSAALLFNN